MDFIDPVALVQPAVDNAAAQNRALRLLFVCTGNICRSPLAHAVFDQQVAQRQLAELFETESAGTHGYHVGDNADSRMRACALRHGLKLDHAARKLNVHDIAYYDLLLAMDRDHLQWMRQLDATGQGVGRIILYREFDRENGGAKDVPDPYYGDQEAFELVWRLVAACTEGLTTALVAAMKSRI